MNTQNPVCIFILAFVAVFAFVTLLARNTVPAITQLCKLYMVLVRAIVPLQLQGKYL